MKFVALVVAAAICVGCGSGGSQSGQAGAGGQGRGGGGGSAVAGIGGGGLSGSGGTAGAVAGATGTAGNGATGGAVAGASGSAGSSGRGGSTGSGGSGTAGEPGAFCTTAWCWSHPLPQGEQINSIWADRGGTVFVGANGGALMRWNGSAWQSIATELLGSTSIVSIWGTSPNDVWATNMYALIRFDGTSWRLFDLPPAAVAGTRPMFRMITGSGPNDVWFVSAEAVYHWTATGWAPKAYLVNSGSPGTPGYLTFVSAASASEVWAISDKKVSRWNGTDFVEVTWPQANPMFLGLSAIGPNDVWVKENNSYWHWDGQKFTLEPGVGTNGGFYTYYELFATTPGDVWTAAGPGHRLSPGNWASVPIDADGYSYPTMGAGLPDGQVFISGSLGRLWRYNGSRVVLTVPAVDPLTLGKFSAVWSDGNGTTLAAGTILLRNVGNGWQPAPHGAPFGGQVNAMWGRSASDVWAVGNTAWVYHYDGAMWSYVNVGVSSTLAQFLDLHTVGGTDTGEVWALGENGQFLHFDGQNWTAGNTASGSDMLAMWIHNPDDIWACGQNGIVQRWTRADGWKLQTARPSLQTDYRTMWGTSESNIWIVNGSDSAFRYDGTKWQNVKTPDEALHAQVFAMSGTPDGTFWAVGYNGYSMRWNGSAFQGYVTSTSRHLNGVWVGANGEAWAVGDNNTILHHR